MKKIIVLLLLIALSASGFFLYRHHETARRDERLRHLTLYGNVEIRRVNLGFRVGGRITEILFEEGDILEKGQTVARLDREPYEDALALSEARVERSEANLLKLRTGNRPQEIEQARAAVKERQAALDVLLSDFNRAEQLVRDRVISAQEFDNVEARRDEAAARKQLAEETLNLLVEGFRKEDIAIGQAELTEAKAQRKSAQTALSDTVLICPNDGVMLTRVEEVGAVVQAGQVVATLSLRDDLWVYVYVSEQDLGRLAPGMRAEIFTDTAPEKPYAGQVGYISPEAEFTPKTVETPELRTSLVYRVRIIAKNPDHGLRQGMPVTVRLQLERETH